MILVQRLSFLGPLLVSADPCIPGTPHTTCHFRDVLTQSSGHHSLTLVKVAYQKCLASFLASNTSTLRIDYLLPKICHPWHLHPCGKLARSWISSRSLIHGWSRYFIQCRMNKPPVNILQLTLLFVVFFFFSLYLFWSYLLTLELKKKKEIFIKCVLFNVFAIHVHMLSGSSKKWKKFFWWTGSVSP